MDTPTYIPQCDPHDALIILNIHNWGNHFFRKNSINFGKAPRRGERDDNL